MKIRLSIPFLLIYSITLFFSCHKKQGAHFSRPTQRSNINDCDAMEIRREKAEKKRQKAVPQRAEKKAKIEKEKPLPKRKLNRNVTGPEDINNCKPKKKEKIPKPEVKENKFSKPAPSKAKRVLTIVGMVLGAIAFASLTVLVVILSLAFGFIAVSIALLLTFAIVAGIAFLVMQFLNQMSRKKIQRQQQRQQQHKNPNVRDEEGKDE